MKYINSTNKIDTDKLFCDYIATISSVSISNDNFDSYIDTFWATFSDSDEDDTTHIVIESLK